MKVLYMIAALLIFVIADQIYETKAANCIRMNYESPEFRVSAGRYDVDTITAGGCSTLCKEENFTYAALMDKKLCLCSYTNEDYPEIDSKCCSDTTLSCDDDPDIMMAMEVEDHDWIKTTLEINIEKTSDSTNIIYDVEVDSSLPTWLSLYLDDELVTEPETAEPRNHKKNYLLEGLDVPGRHVFKAVALDSVMETVQDVAEEDYYAPDDVLKHDLHCPPVVAQNEDFKCFVSIYRGMDLTLEIEFEGEDPQKYVVPDAALMTLGPYIPRYIDPEKLISPPSIAYLGLGRLPYGKIVAFEYYATAKGQFTIQILAPDCGNEDTFCGSCRSDCPEENIISCQSEAESLCSLIVGCAENADTLTCIATPEASYKTLQTIDVEAAGASYWFKNLDRNEYVDIEPGYILSVTGFETDELVIASVTAEEEFIEEGKVDTDEDGNTLGVRHYIRFLVAAISDITFAHNFSEVGEYKMNTKMSSEYLEEASIKEATILVMSHISGLVLQGGDYCTAVGESLTLNASYEKGSDVILTWFKDSEEWKSYPIDSSKENILEDFECVESGNITVMLEASNDYNSVNDSATICCMHLVSRNWIIETDSPKITPPGEMTISLQYTGDEDKFPEHILSDWNFGDDTTDEGIPFQSAREKVDRLHIFSQSGIFNVTIRVYNNFDLETFTEKVELIEKLGLLEANIFYKLNEDSDIEAPHGPENTDVPLNSNSVFMCNVTGLVEKYTLSIESESFEDTSEDGMFSYQFKEVGEYEAVCQASNNLETSNSVTLKVRVLAETTGLNLIASKLELVPYEEVEFTLTFESTDRFTCYTFDAGDRGIQQAFGNENTCKQFIQESEMEFNPRESKRKRRETQKAEWIDDNTISIIYSYASGGTFQPVAEAFNSIYRTDANTKVAVAFPESSIWIENNSTNIKYPMKFRRSETFRLETTAILFDHPSYSYEMSWEVNEITKTGNFIRNIDISDIKSFQCSAIRFPKHYLDIGLYSVYYYIKIYENGTYLETASCFTYLEIISTPLQPMIIRGGASYILRGYGQVVDLEPDKYSEDQDDPEDKDFKIEWSCRYFKPEKFLDEGEEYDSSISLSLKAISWPKVKETESMQSCFKDDKDYEILDGSRVSFNTNQLVAFQTIYEIEVTVSKDSRTSYSRILIDVIEDIPPSILITCERRVACIPVEEGFLVNPSSRLTIRAECVEDCKQENMVYEWDIYAVDEGKSELIPLDEWRSFVVVDEDRLGIHKNFFEVYKENKYFHIQVMGIDSAQDRPKGVAKLYIKINQPSKAGSCQISSSTGTAMITLFNMDFQGWTDPENRGLIDYSIYINYEGTKYRIHYGVKTFVDFILPPGESEVMCAVEDADGAVTMLSVEMVTAVMPEDDERERYIATVNQKFFAVEGKMSVMAQSIAAEAFVEKNARENNFESVAEEVDRIWLSYKELPGIDTSYFTKEAREEIEAEVRDNRAKEEDALAERNFEMFKSIEFLPFEVMPDAEVYGQAISALAETRPLNKGSKNLLNAFIGDMFKSTENTEVAHVEEKEVANMIIANSMNCLSKTISDEVIGGNFLQSELEEAYDFLSYNITQPNFFILYVEGSRWEVAERVHQAKVDGVKNMSEAEVQNQVSNLKNITHQITSEMITDIMVGEALTVDTSSGLQIKTEKKHAAELSGATIDSEGSSITLPNSCFLLGKPENCENIGSVGMVSVKWTSIFEVGGTENVNLSPESNTLDFSLTNREGNASIKVNDIEEPFEICLSISPPSEDNTQRSRYVLPNFGKDDFLVYHELTLDKEGSAVKMDLTPGEDADFYVLFYGVGFKPSLLVYDGRIFLKDIENNEGIYSALFGLNDNSYAPGDAFYLAVGHLVDKPPKKDKNLVSDSNLTRDDMTNQFATGYSIALYTSGCYYFSEESSMWSSDGCKVHSAHSGKICCYCNHLTMFGSGFLIAPNTIDFEYVFANAGFEDNIIIYLTLIITFCLYIILAIWARWKDRKDLKKLGATPLLDNDVKDKYLYEIMVQTGFQINAGTKSKVHFIISGEDDETDVRTFTDDQRPIFERGALNVFVMSVPRCLGQLNYLRIWHDNSGKGKSASWFLNFVVVKDLLTGYKYEFIAERWFAVEKGDGLIDHLIPVAGKEQTTEFSHLFPNATRRNLSDNHLWLSVFTRPARSRFTRVQRLSCCLAVLYLSMLTSAMWYQRTPEQPSPGAFKLGPLSLSPEQVSVGIMSNLIIFPPSFLMIFFFRKSRARCLRPSHVNVALEKQYERWRKNYGTSEEAKENSKTQNNSKKQRDEEGMFVKKKKKLLLPWWCVFISWFLVIISVGCSLFFLWAYGLQFGNERTKKWLTSLMISFFSSVLLTEPIKILCMAIIMACLCGNPDVDEDDADDDEEDPRIQKDEEWLHDINPGVSVQRPKYRPIDLKSLEAARKLREKEIQMYNILREIGVYALYLWILMILSFGNRDPNSFYIREAVINNIIKPGDLWVDFHNVNTEGRFWNWTREALIPELFAGKWYNERIPLGMRLMLDDRNNFKVGYPVLRQIRAAKDVCKVPWQMEDIISECAGFGNVINEDGRLYKKNWKRNYSIETRIPQEYKYLTAGQLNGFPFWGQLDWYGGGGYVVPLIAKLYEDGAKLIQQMTKLEQSGWIDKDTRAVFIEFGTYNAQVNLFVVATIVAEFVPGGGIVPYYHIDPIKLLHYHTGAGFLQLGCQIGFVIFTIYYTVFELLSLCKQGRKYFSEYWNLAEVANLLAAYSIIGVEIYKLIITFQILAKFTATEGTGYIKLQEALILDECFCYLIGFLMSLATLKFIKLLRFNQRIGGIIATVRMCAKELKGYAVCLLITFFAFVTLFWLILGRGVREFSSFLYSFESSISMMLKKFNYEDIEKASPIMGPIAFFTFALTASVILVNILLTIIIQTFEEVRMGINPQNDEYQLVSFIIGRLKLFLRIGKNKTQVNPVILQTKKENKNNSALDAFSGKVDKLLDFINSVYLEERMDIDFLNKSLIKSSAPVVNENLEKKKSRPRKIPRYQSNHMKKHLDF